MHKPSLNRFSRDVVFDKHYFVDWLSEWKVTHVNFVWANFRAYRQAAKDFVAYAHLRGVRVFVHYVPYRPGHEDPPPSITKTEMGSDNAADCPRDPAVRKWYMDRLTELITQEPRFDGAIIESPYHDGVYCKCATCWGKKNPLPENVLLAEMTELVRKHRPDMPIVRVMKQPVPDDATARRLADELKPLEGPLDWHVNTFRDGDGILDGYLGTRSKYLVRLNMQELAPTARRPNWSQCGCHTTAMDVDGDGRWDLFAGSGDDRGGKGVLHRYDPITLDSVWSYKTDDNASSADPVLADIDGDGQVEIIKSVDNYAGDDAHDAVYAFETDGTLLWKVEGLSGEDSPNVADLDGDGSVEIVGMTFGSEVYCLDAQGHFKWRRDLRPELDDKSHAYMTPVLCDLDGNSGLEILAMTNGGYFDRPGAGSNGVLFALSSSGEILDRLDVGGPRYWGKAFCCNIDDDPYLELVVSGSGGLDVVQTRGYGPNTEHFQRRRDYQRLSVLPWAYEDTYFVYRGQKQGVTNGTDDLMLEETDGRYREQGKYVTELLTLPPNGFFNRLRFDAQTPPGTALAVNILDGSGNTLMEDVNDETTLHLDQSVRLEFLLTTTDVSATPVLNEYSLSFDRKDSSTPRSASAK